MGKGRETVTTGTSTTEIQNSGHYSPDTSGSGRVFFTQYFIKCVLNLELGGIMGIRSTLFSTAATISGSALSTCRVFYLNIDFSCRIPTVMYNI